jgi:hypothetical protein
VQDPYPSSHSNSFRIGYIIQKQSSCQEDAGNDNLPALSVLLE